MFCTVDLRREVYHVGDPGKPMLWGSDILSIFQITVVFERVVWEISPLYEASPFNTCMFILFSSQ